LQVANYKLQVASYRLQVLSKGIQGDLVMAKAKKVAIMMGSKSDMEIMDHCAQTLKKFGIEADMRVLSAHRTPKQTIAFAGKARKKGYKIIIAAAGGAAHLAGVVSAHTTLPVIGVPIETKSLAGIDSLFSTVQMPAGIPVACMAIGKAGAVNAAIFAAEILALENRQIHKNLDSHKADMAKTVLGK
jgi:5-(carboxyamino)imidazole ribonucleotide mutase